MEKRISTMASNAELVAQVYIGFYDRAPDPVGLQYWIGRLEAGVSIQGIGDSFAASPEASDTYPFFEFPDLLSQNDFLAEVYQNVFGRAIDADGLNYYSARMTAGESAGSVVASILGNASTNEGSPDQTYLQNKVDAGIHWSTEAATTNANVYQENGRLTDSASGSAHAILDGITADPATVDAANTASDAYFASGGLGEIFTLTNFTNVQTGGVDGGAGTDVLNISAGGILPNAAPVISNGETINNADGTPLDLTSVTGIQNINSSDFASNYSHASLDTIYGASANATVVTIGIEASVAGANDTLHLAVDDNVVAVTFNTYNAHAVHHSVGRNHHGFMPFIPPLQVGAPARDFSMGNCHGIAGPVPPRSHAAI
ncbi:DUF4214 domain-containing protein [Mesorhizobium sp. A623]